MRTKPRLILSLAAIYIAFTYILFTAGVGAYRVNKGRQPLDFDKLTISDVTQWRAVKGECYVAYELIGYEESTDDNKTTTTNYYWLVDCGDNDLMLLKTRAKDPISDSFNEMVELYWNSTTWEEYANGLTSYAEIDGVFIENDSEIVGFYNEWASEMSASDEWSSSKLAPFTLDCTRTYGARITEFRIGTGLIVGGVLIIGIIIFVLVKAAKPNGNTPAYAPAGNYGNLQDGSYDTYTSNNTAPASSPYGSQQANTPYGSGYPQQPDQYNTGYQQQTNQYNTGYQQPDQYNTVYQQPDQYNTGYQPQGGQMYPAPDNNRGNNF